MRVKDLIAHLEGMPEDAEVHFQYNYGDHWRTQVAPTVDTIEMGFVKFSDYHRMPEVLNEEETYDEETGLPLEDLRKVVLIG